MSLVDMKLSKKDTKKEFAVTSEDAPRFPHGLSIHLDSQSLKKLGFDSLPDVGQEFKVVGVGPVERANEHKRQNGVDRSMTIQLQKLEVSPADDAVSAVERGIKEANS